MAMTCCGDGAGMLVCASAGVVKSPASNARARMASIPGPPIDELHKSTGLEGFGAAKRHQTSYHHCSPTLVSPVDFTGVGSMFMCPRSPMCASIRVKVWDQVWD